MSGRVRRSSGSLTPEGLTFHSPFPSLGSAPTQSRKGTVTCSQPLSLMLTRMSGHRSRRLALEGEARVPPRGTPPFPWARALTSTPGNVCRVGDAPCVDTVRVPLHRSSPCFVPNRTEDFGALSAGTSTGSS